VSARAESLDALVREIEAGAATELVLWDRGGPPGPGYESNHLTVRDEGGTMSGIYVRTRYDRDTPPYRVDEYETVFAKPLGGLAALAERVFGVAYPEEEEPDLGGVTKLTVEMSAGGVTATKTFYERWPEPLRALGGHLETLARECEEKGTHRDGRPG
jgi:hypothetical protein